MSRSRGDSQLVNVVLQASGRTRAQLDEQYLLHAFVVAYGSEASATPIVVELLDHGTNHAADRWQAMAYDEFTGAATELGQGATAEDALNALNWRRLD